MERLAGHFLAFCAGCFRFRFFAGMVRRLASEDADVRVVDVVVEGGGAGDVFVSFGNHVVSCVFGAFFEFEDVMLEGFCVLVCDFHSGSFVCVFVRGVGVGLAGVVLGIEPFVLDGVAEDFSFHAAREFPSCGFVGQAVQVGEAMDGQSRVLASVDVDVPEALEYASLFIGEVFHGCVVEAQGSHGGVL
jgi:hypothetical protein